MDCCIFLPLSLVANTCEVCGGWQDCGAYRALNCTISVSGDCWWWGGSGLCSCETPIFYCNTDQWNSGCSCNLICMFTLLSRVVEAKAPMAIVIPVKGSTPIKGLRADDLSWQDFLGRADRTKGAKGDSMDTFDPSKGRC